MARQDFLLADDGDLRFADGDLVIGASGTQEIRAILVSYRGNWLRTPFVGVGISDELLNDGNLAALQQDIISQLTLDGFTNARIVWDETGSLQVTAQ